MKKEELEFDETAQLPMSPVQSPEEAEVKKEKKAPAKKDNPDENGLVCCLRQERITVRHINKRNGLVTSEHHVLAGGMAPKALRIFSVPKLANGRYVDVLTKSEKEYLEHIMGLEYNALSIYKAVDNFWDDSSDEGKAIVELGKGDTYLDLRNPLEYIKYKILLANRDFIAPSIDVYNKEPKATYEYVLISDKEEENSVATELNTKVECYKAYGKVEDDKAKLMTIIEILDGRPLSSETKDLWIKKRINELIELDSTAFFETIKDPLLDSKVLLKQAVKHGIVSNRDGHYYNKENGTPLCSEGQMATLNMAAAFLNQPKNQEYKFSIEAKLQIALKK